MLNICEDFPERGPELFMPLFYTSFRGNGGENYQHGIDTKLEYLHHNWKETGVKWKVGNQNIDRTAPLPTENNEYHTSGGQTRKNVWPLAAKSSWDCENFQLAAQNF